jgi:hypothetical protein
MERPENIFSQPIKQAHLQFARVNAQTENCKRAYFTNSTDTATLNGQTMDEKEGRRHKSTYPKGGVSCPKESFVVNQTLVFQIKFCGKSPALRVAAKRWVQCFLKKI